MKRDETRRDPSEPGYGPGFGERYTDRDASNHDTFNRRFAQNTTVFTRACEVAGCNPTKRQAGKFQREEGAAFKKLEVSGQARDHGSHKTPKPFLRLQQRGNAHDTASAKDGEKYRASVTRPGSMTK